MFTFELLPSSLPSSILHPVSKRSAASSPGEKKLGRRRSSLLHIVKHIQCIAGSCIKMYIMYRPAYTTQTIHSSPKNRAEMTVWHKNKNKQSKFNNNNIALHARNISRRLIPFFAPRTAGLLKLITIWGGGGYQKGFCCKTYKQTSSIQYLLKSSYCCNVLTKTQGLTWDQNSCYMITICLCF